jgi:hypothetical protein
MKYTALVLIIFLSACDLNIKIDSKPSVENSGTLEFTSNFKDYLSKAPARVKEGADIYLKLVKAKNIVYEIGKTNYSYELETNFKIQNSHYDYTDYTTGVFTGYDIGGGHQFQWVVVWGGNQFIMKKKCSLYFASKQWMDEHSGPLMANVTNYKTEKVVTKEEVRDDDDRTIAPEQFYLRTNGIEVHEEQVRAMGWSPGSGQMWGNFAAWDELKKFGFERKYIEKIITNEMKLFNLGFSMASTNIKLTSVKF